MNEVDSSPVEIRRLWQPDKEAFRDHLLSLDPHSRHLRFGGGMADDFLVHYAENCFGKGDLIYGAFVDGKMVGAAELRSNQAIWSEQTAIRASDPRRSGVLRRRRLSPPRHRREAVQAHPAGGHQPRRRNDRDRLPPGKCRDAESGEEVRCSFHFRAEFADRPSHGAPADRVFADPGSLRRCARLRRRAVRLPLAGGGGRAGKEARNGPASGTGVSVGCGSPTSALARIYLIGYNGR